MSKQSFKQFNEEQVIVKSLERQGLIEQILNVPDDEWIEQTAEESLAELATEIAVMEAQENANS